MERHLAAILAADVVGYSRLMERDESGAFERLRAHRKELFEPEIEKHHGRIFKLMGDGVLAEFGSVVDAVECAVTLQRGMAERNNGVADDQRIDVRIGINLGDVIIEGDDLHGDGVNIAARLQHLADAGGICVSGKVAKEVERKLPFTFQPMGEQKVKNIDEPVTVYRVLSDGIARPRQVPKDRSGFSLSRALAMAVALILLIVAGGVAAWKFYPSAPPAGPPSIAVLPFVNMGGDSADNYLGEGLAEDIITELSTFPTLQVVSRTSSFVYDKPVKVQQVAADLGVSYVLEGSVRKAGGKIRVTAQLIDARTGDHVWADRYDEESDNVVALQGEVASKIYASLGGLRGEITKSEEAVAWQKAAPDLEEYDYYLRGHALLYRETKEDMLRARQIWEEGLKKFPNSALLRVKICFVYEVFIERGWSEDVAADIEAAWKLATEAQAMENKSKLATWLGHWVMAFMYQLHDGDFERSVAEAEAAVRIVPYESRMRSDLGYFLANAGRTQEGVEWTEMAIRVDPNGPVWFRWNLAWAYYLANRPEEALSEFQKVGADSGTTLAAVYARLGQMDKARAVMAEFVKQSPDWTLRDEALWPTGKRAGLKEPLASAYLEDLRKAGMPE
ncbi:MAG TPA: adenylate/guanylate cyclase domain-containing protein [Verrucomicrobiae bacterium]|nr:adenylate/guanylate cyclase domain-containing protein [Verrucomicrobiae bacterium]